jgi:hypothetical protein
LELAQWLVNRFSLTIEDVCSEDSDSLHYAYRNRHLDVAQWIIDEFELTAEEISPYPKLRPSLGPLVKSAAKMV